MRITILCLLIVLLISCRTESPKVTTDRISVNLTSNPKGLNPLLYLGRSDNMVTSLLFQNLADYNPQTLEFEPVLAKEITPVIKSPTDAFPERIRFDIEIRKDAVWDDGTPITGMDYAFTLKTIFIPTSNALKYRAYFQDLLDVVVDENNPKKFSVYLKKRTLSSLETFWGFPILNAAFYDRKGIIQKIELSEILDEEAYAQNSNKGAIDAYGKSFSSSVYSVDSINGSGPYVVKEWLNKQYVLIEKKDNYWGDLSDNVHLNATPKEIQFIISPDKASAFTQLKAGVFDIYEGLTVTQLEELKNNETYKDAFSIESIPLQRFYYFILNSRNKKMSDVAVRKALSHLVDVDAIIEQAENGEAERINSPFLTVDKYSTLKDISFDIERAKKLLAEANWKDTNGNGILDKEINGETIELELNCISTGSQLGQILIGVLSQNAAEIGIKINTDNVDRSIYQKRLKAHDFDLTLSAKGLSLSPVDPYNMFHTDNVDEGEANYGNFGNEASDKLIGKIRATLDEEERRSLYLELEKMIVEDGSYIFLYQPTNKMAFKKDIKGTTSIKLPGFDLKSFERIPMN